MALMNLNLDGVLTVEKVVIPADGITTLSHSLFRGEKIIARYNDEDLTRGQDFIPDRIDDRLYFQKNVCLFTVLKILNESLFGKEIEVEYFACGDYINAEIWNEYPSSASLKASLASKVDNSDYRTEIKRIDSDINAESTARIEADNALQDNINTETALRIAEDEKLQTNIDSEATARTNADNTLQTNIDAEATSRQTGDTEIRTELSNETDLRLAGDTVLQSNINSEATARTDADNTLQANIDAETSTRAENDSNLQSQISDLKTKFESFVPGLTYKVVSSLPTADILTDVIYLVLAENRENRNVYNEYLYIDDSWELIGTTATTQAITVDSALSSTSTNPVQNKVINEALRNKLDITGNAATATKLKNKVNIIVEDNNAEHPGVAGSFDGSGSCYLKLPSTINADITGSAVKDSHGNNIRSTYIKELTVSGKTITYKRGDNSTGTITTQDTVYAHPTYTARTGVPTANLAPAFGETFTVTQPVSNETGHITEMNSRTIKIPNTLATEALSGLLSSADKLKLNNIGYATGPTVSIPVASYIVIITIANQGGYYYTDKEVVKDGATMSANVNFGSISVGKVTIVTGTDFNLKTRTNGGMRFIYFKG